MLSIILYPKFLSITEQFYLTVAASLAVAATVRTHCPDDVAIKWPNDIYQGDRKLAGILIQNGLSGNRLSWSVIGIGLNVNQREFPAELPNPGSLLLATGQPVDLDLVRQQLLQQVEQHYLRLRQGQRDALFGQYEQQLYRRGQPADFLGADGERFRGTIRGVAPGGKLMLDIGGELKYFDFRELRFLIAK